jgi:hypothetical protein
MICGICCLVLAVEGDVRFDFCCARGGMYGHLRLIAAWTMYILGDLLIELYSILSEGTQ